MCCPCPIFVSAWPTTRKHILAKFLKWRSRNFRAGPGCLNRISASIGGGVVPAPDENIGRELYIVQPYFVWLWCAATGSTRMIKLISAPIRRIVRFPLFQLAIVIGVILWLQAADDRSIFGQLFNGLDKLVDATVQLVSTVFTIK